MKLDIKSGNVSDAAKIIREAAEWLVDVDMPFWDPEIIDEEYLLTKSSKEDIYVAYIDGEAAAAMTLDWEDQLFWPDIPVGQSGFLHKLSVARKFAGKGIPTKLIKFAEQKCLEKGIYELRLDCGGERTKLGKFYEKNGFVLLERKIYTLTSGESGDTAFYVKTF